MAFTISFSYNGGMSIQTRDEHWMLVYQAPVISLAVFALSFDPDYASTITVQCSCVDYEVGILVTHSKIGHRIYKRHRDLIGIENLTEENITRVINQMIEDLLST